MEIVLIGAGNLATNLGKALVSNGHKVVQVFSRTAESAKALAELLGCPFTTALDDIRNEADMFIVSLNDLALVNLAEELAKGREDQLMVHTAGSIDVDVIRTERRGVFYPMQTFSKNKEVDFSEIPIFIEANNEADLLLIENFSTSLSQKIYRLGSEDRKYVHLSAVFCCNFANHCFALSEKLLKEHGGVPFEVMLPLIDETARKVHSLSPKEGQTGPAARWDTNVMVKQLNLLDEYPMIKDIYALMSKSIHEL